MVEEKSPVIRANQVMHEKVIFIDGMSTAVEAAAKMRSEGVSTLMVEKRDPDDAWGILVTQDLIQGVFVAGRSASEVNVYEVMTKPVITVPADMDFRYAVRLLHRAGIRRAPVEDNGKIIGMFSLSSLIMERDLF